MRLARGRVLQCRCAWHPGMSAPRSWRLRRPRAASWPLPHLHQPDGGEHRVFGRRPLEPSLRAGGRTAVLRSAGQVVLGRSARFWIRRPDWQSPCGRLFGLWGGLTIAGGACQAPTRDRCLQHCPTCGRPGGQVWRGQSISDWPAGPCFQPFIDSQFQLLTRLLDSSRCCFGK